ncbi:MAG: hypothetical protein DRJ40_07700 [Thermoprotei archaeon]|nr:MAG: hypothetical protein DRJ40_07700 [Thermoprotei archaeon]
MSTVKEVTERYSKGTVIRVEGPVTIKVISGKLMGVGIEFGESSTVVIPYARSYGFKVLTSSEVRFIVGPGGSVSVVPPESEVVDFWYSALSTLFTRYTRGRFLIIGATDSGKSTVTAWLTNLALSKGLTTAIVDGDVGQNDVAIPTTLALALPREPKLSIREYEPYDLYFIGHVAPASLIPKYVRGLRALLEECDELGLDVVVVNTDGWVEGRSAINFKVKIVEATKPSAVIIMERRVGELQELVSEVQKLCSEVYRLPSPPSARIRTRSDRRKHRENMYARYFSKAKTIALKATTLDIVYGSKLLSTVPVNSKLPEVRKVLRGKVLYVGISRDGKYGVVVLDKTHRVNTSAVAHVLGVEEVHIFTRGQERGLLVGLLEDEDRYIGVGIIDGIDYRNLVLRIRARLHREKPIRGIDVGFIRLSESFDEIEKSNTYLL